MGFSAIFATLFLAELPDKTSLAALALVSRYRALVVWVASSLALVSQTVLALAAGRVLALVPKKPLTLIEAALFVVLAVWILKESLEDPAKSHADEGAPPKRRGWSALPRIFVLVFVAEFMDLTQVATATFAANHPTRIWLVGVAAALALVSANAVVVSIGGMVLRKIRGAYLQRAAGLLFAIIGISLAASVWHVQIV